MQASTTTDDGGGKTNKQTRKKKKTNPNTILMLLTKLKQHFVLEALSLPWVAFHDVQTSRGEPAPTRHPRRAGDPRSSRLPPEERPPGAPLGHGEALLTPNFPRATAAGLFCSRKTPAEGASPRNPRPNRSRTPARR